MQQIHLLPTYILMGKYYTLTYSICCFFFFFLPFPPKKKKKKLTINFLFFEGKLQFFFFSTSGRELFAVDYI